MAKTYSALSQAAKLDYQTIIPQLLQKNSRKFTLISRKKSLLKSNETRRSNLVSRKISNFERTFRQNCKCAINSKKFTIISLINSQRHNFNATNEIVAKSGNLRGFLPFKIYVKSIFACFRR